MRPDDESIVRACLRGDRAAFATLLDRHQRAVYNVALRMVNDREDASDITQNVFAKAFENLDRFDFRYRFYSWIYRIAVNESIKLLEQRRPVEPVDERHLSAERSPEEIAGSRELARTVQRALMSLPPDHRTVIVLRHYLQFSYREIGEILEIPEKTVKSRLFTARQRLRDAVLKTGAR